MAANHSCCLPSGAHEPLSVLAERYQLALRPFPFRFVLHYESAIPWSARRSGDAEEGEGLWRPLATPLTRDSRAGSISRVLSSWLVPGLYEWTQTLVAQKFVFRGK